MNLSSLFLGRCQFITLVKFPNKFQWPRVDRVQLPNGLFFLRDIYNSESSPQKDFFVQVFTVVSPEFNPHIPHSLTVLHSIAISAEGQIQRHSSSVAHDLPSRGRQGGSDGYTVSNLLAFDLRDG